MLAVRHDDDDDDDSAVCKENEIRLILKCYLLNVFTNNLIHMYNEDLVLNNLLWLLCHKIKPNVSNI